MKRKPLFLRKEPGLTPWLFSLSWEQRKFHELALIERGGSPRPIEAFITDSPDGLNWIKIGDAPSQGKYITKTEEKIRPEGLSKTRVVQPGDLILSNSMSFGRPYIMGISGCIHDGWLLIRNTKNVFDLTFLCHLLGSEQMLEQYGTFAAGSTVNNLNKELVGSAIVKYPSIDEQRKIGTYLERVDDLITLHQRAIGSAITTGIMKGCRETIFWEQRKLGDVAQVRTGFPFDSKDFSDDGEFLVITNGNIQDDDPEVNYKSGNRIDVSDEHLKIQYVLGKGDVLVTMDGTVGRTAKVTHEQLILAQRVGRLTVNRGAEFLYQALNSGAFYEAMTSLSHGGTIKHISLSEIGEYEFQIPTSEKEQEQIGRFFHNLDRLITLHQREFTHKKQNTNYVKYYQRDRPLLHILRTMDKSV